MIYEVQVAGTTVQMDNRYACEDAFKKSHGDTQMLEYLGETKKVIMSKKAKGFRLKDIARFKN